MPGAQDRWDQLTEPGVRSQEATPPDLSRLADRPERGSFADLRQRLERLPAGHPSSPYNDDLSRKLPVASLKDLELPLQGTERDLNGAAKHHEHGLSEGATRNGAGGRSLAAETVDTADWSSTADADGLAGAESLSTPDGLGTPPDDDLITSDDLGTANGLGATEGLGPADSGDGHGVAGGWLSAPDWSGATDLAGA